jgi:hypothetical protein
LNWIVANPRSILGVITLCLGGFIILCNVLIMILGLLKKATSSMVPLLGGLLTMMSLLLLEYPGYVAILPFLLDPGCSLMLISAMVVWLRGDL